MLKLELGCGANPTPGYVHHDRIKHSDHVDLAWDLRRFPWPFLEKDGAIVFGAYPLYSVSAMPMVMPMYERRTESDEVLREAIRKAIVQHRSNPGELICASTSAAVEEAAVPGPGPSGFLDEILALDVFEHVTAEIQPWLDECWRLLKPGGLLEIRLPAWDAENSYRDPTHLRLFHRDTFFYWDTAPAEGFPDRLWQDFGRYYFSSADGAPYEKWWKVESVARENYDFRYRMTKRAPATSPTE